MPINSAAPIIAELGFIVLAVIVFYAGSKRYGALRTGVFLAGSILWTAPLENFAVLKSAYTYYAFANILFPGYPGYLIWLGVVPFWIVLGWFVVAMSCFILFHEAILPNRRALLQALAAGLLAVNVDLMMDPIASSNGLWVWMFGALRIIGVPVYNFIAWFLLIFLYDLIAQHTILNSKRMIGLSSIERLVLRRGEGTSERPDLSRLVMRIVLLETFVIVFLTVFNAVTVG